MAKRSRVTEMHFKEIAAVYQKASVSRAKLLQMFPQYSKASIYRHAKKPIGEDARCDKRTHTQQSQVGLPNFPLKIIRGEFYVQFQS